MFVVLDPPPGGLQRLHARADPPRARPALWLLAGAGLATAAAVVLLLRPAPAPLAPPAPVAAAAKPAPDLIAGRDLTTLHPAWIGLRELPPPTEPLLLATELTGALASRRIAVADNSVVLYMLDPKQHLLKKMPQ